MRTFTIIFAKQTFGQQFLEPAFQVQMKISRENWAIREPMEIEERNIGIFFGFPHEYMFCNCAYILVGGKN